MSSKTLEKLFSSKARSKVLNLFFMNPKNKYYLRQIESITKLSISSIQNEVKNLLQLNILSTYKDGNRCYFELNNNHYLYNELKSIIIKTSGIAETLKRLLEDKNKDIKFAFIYGSYAKGTETITSDIDICIIGDILTKTFFENIEKQKELIDREINPHIYLPSEFKIKYSEKHHFINEIVQTEKIFIIGNENGFKQFIESE